jgi:hypothetical protein
MRANEHPVIQFLVRMFGEENQEAASDFYAATVLLQSVGANTLEAVEVFRMKFGEGSVEHRTMIELRRCIQLAQGDQRKFDALLTTGSLPH